MYLHAGEFYMGAGNDLENNCPYDSDPSLPSALAQHGVIIVTLNYRLSNLGFLAADELRSRDAAGSTGNYGIQDQRQVTARPLSIGELCNEENLTQLVCCRLGTEVDQR